MIEEMRVLTRKVGEKDIATLTEIEVLVVVEKITEVEDSMATTNL